MHPKSRPPVRIGLHPSFGGCRQSQTSLFADELDDATEAPSPVLHPLQPELHAPLPGGPVAALFLPAPARSPGHVLAARPNLFAATLHDRDDLIRSACKAATAAGWTDESVETLRRELEDRNVVEVLRRCTRDFTLWTHTPRYHHRTLLLEGLRSTARLMERMQQLLHDEGCGPDSIALELGQIDTRCFARAVRQATAIFTVRYSEDHLLCGPPPLHGQTYLRWDGVHDDGPETIEQIDLDLVCYGGKGLPFRGGYTAFENTASVDELLHAARHGNSPMTARGLTDAEAQLRDHDYCTAVRWLQLHSGLQYRLTRTQRDNSDIERPIRFA